MENHWYFGTNEPNTTVSVQSFGNRIMISLPGGMTVMAGEAVSFSYSQTRGFSIRSRNPQYNRGGLQAQNAHDTQRFQRFQGIRERGYRGPRANRANRNRGRPGPRGPIHANRNQNDHGQQRGGGNYRGRYKCRGRGRGRGIERGRNLQQGAGRPIVACPPSPVHLPADYLNALNALDEDVPNINAPTVTPVHMNIDPQPASEPVIAPVVEPNGVSNHNQEIQQVIAEVVASLNAPLVLDVPDIQLDEAEEEQDWRIVTGAGLENTTSHTAATDSVFGASEIETEAETEAVPTEGFDGLLDDLITFSDQGSTSTL